MDILKYKKYEPIYFIGHSKIDIDSAVSSFLMCNIFNHFGVKSFYCVLKNGYDMDSYNTSMVNDCMNYNPVILDEEDIDDKYFVLVDHNDPVQSIKNKDRVLFCVDHHIDSNVLEEKYISTTCSCSLYIYELFKDIYSFSEEEKKQIFYAFLNDSTFGKSNRCKKSDVDIARSLGFDDDFDVLFKKYFIPTDLSNGIDMNSGLKEYNFGNVNFMSNGIKSFDTNKLSEYKELCLAKDRFLGIWWDYTDNKTYCFFKYDNDFLEFNYNYIASRATTVVKDFLIYLESKNYL